MLSEVLNALLAALLLGLGAVLLTAGADAFTEHVRTSASALGVSVLALGVLLAGAEPEEAVTAALASAQGHPALAAGDAVGSNLVILTLSVGLAAVLVPLPVSRRVKEYAGAAAGATALGMVFLLNGVLGRVEGALLVLGYAAGVAWAWRREKEPPVVGETSGTVDPDDPDGDAGAEPSRALLAVLLGFLGMVAGGLLAVQGAERLVDVIGVSESVVGLTVLALATSAEMVALVWAARRRGMTELVLAGVVGAVAYNATVSLGLAAVVSPLALGKGSPVVPVGAATAVLVLGLVLLGDRLPRTVGALLVLAYPLCVGWLFLR